MVQDLKNYVGFGFKVERDKSGKFWNFIIRCSTKTANSVFSGTIPDFIRPYPLYLHDIERQSISLIAYMRKRGAVSKHATPVVIDDGEVFITCPYKPWMQLREYVSERAQHFISSFGVVKLILPENYGPQYEGKPYGAGVKAKYVKNHMDLLALNEGNLELIKINESPEPVPEVVTKHIESMKVTVVDTKGTGNTPKTNEPLGNKAFADYFTLQVLPERLLVKSKLGSRRVTPSTDLDIIGLVFRWFLENRDLKVAKFNEWCEDANLEHNILRINSHLKYIGVKIYVDSHELLCIAIAPLHKDPEVRRSSK